MSSGKSGPDIPPEVAKVKSSITMDNLPHIQYLKIGGNNQGYWSFAKFYLQVEDFLDCLEVAYVILLEVDWSQGHGLLKPDGLNVHRINMCVGCKSDSRKNHGRFHDTVVSEEDLGDGDSKTSNESRRHPALHL